MVNIRVAHATRKFLICCTTVAVTFANIMPAYGYQPVQNAITLNDINLAIKFEKLIEKANKYFKLNDTKKLPQVMLDMKHETESYTGQKIDLNKGLDQVEREIKAKGGKLSKSEIKALRKIIKDGDKKHNHKALYMAACMESGAEYNPEMVPLEFDCLCKASKAKDEDEGEEMVLPVLTGLDVYIF